MFQLLIEIDLAYAYNKSEADSGAFILDYYIFTLNCFEILRANVTQNCDFRREI